MDLSKSAKTSSHRVLLYLDRQRRKCNPGEHGHTRYPLLRFTSPRRREISYVRDNRIQNDHSPLLFLEESQEKRSRKKNNGKVVPHTNTVARYNVEIPSTITLSSQALL